MSHPPLAAWLARRPAAVARGPLSVLLIEDEVEVASTLDHHIAAGFRHILALSPEPLSLTPAQAQVVTNLSFQTRARDAHVAAVNAVIEAVPAGTWLHYGFNAEYLFFPFSDTRRVTELLAFHTEERRSAMLTYVVDLYPPDLSRFPDGVSRAEAMFDRTGYYALARRDRDGRVMERQLDFHGGLRWRFEEYLPADRLRIDRIALFQARPGLRLMPDHRLTDEEMNTYACPWHHNLTAAIASFRVAKALMRNPRSRNRIKGFAWRHSTPFAWSSQQLMDAGLMEPGQWF